MRKILFIILFIPLSYGAFSQAYKIINATGINFYADPPNNNNYVLLQSPVLGSSITFTLPPTIGTNGFALMTLGNGSLTWSNPASGSGGAAGNNGEVQFNDNGSFGASSNLFWDNANNRLGINNNAPEFNLDVDADIKVGSSSNQAGLIIYSEQGATDYEVKFQAPDNLSADVTFQWPDEDGAADQLLITDGNGQLSWSTDNTSSGNDCVGEGADGGDAGGSNNAVTAGNGFIGGGEDNTISSGGSNAFIGGGSNNSVSGENSVVFVGEDNDITGNSSFIGSGSNNSIDSDFSVIFGGQNNTINDGGDYSMIGAGEGNSISSRYCAIGAGQNNEISTGSDYSVIGAGQTNFIEDSPYSSIGGGQNNSINTSGSYSSIGGGQNNEITGAWSFIGAGDGNLISGDYSVILGGRDNTVSGDYSAIAGTRDNEVSGDYALVMGRNSTATGDYSVAIGRNSNAIHEGAFVISDEGDQALNSSTINQITAKFAGGYRFFCNGTSQGVRMQGGNSLWESASDSNLKENIFYPNPILFSEKLNILKIYSWSYIGYEKDGIRNYGPMAQDFYNLFGDDGIGKIGEEKWLSPHHLSSVTILALQGLHKKYEENKKIIEELKAKNSLQKEKLEELKKLYKELEELKK
jgi:hypothetical protein